jgi:alpha-amylase
MRMKTLLVAALSAAVLTISCAGTAPDALAINGRQRPVKPGTPAPQGPVQWQHDWVRGAVFYQVFVRSFQDSNGDGVGDLRGLIDRLDYLNDGDPATTTDLGVDALWLMPVFESPSYHGYDVVDYENIDREYGTNADFEELCQKAHARGMRIIVDFVINHTGRDHPWFKESASSPTSPKRDWYVWSETDKGWKQPWGGNYGTWHPSGGMYYYGVFWGGMPDLNFRSPEVREEIKRIARLWLARGLDGYRLDATRYLVENGAGLGQADTAETHQYLKEFGAAVREAKPDAMLVGENWTETEIIADYFGSTAEITGGDELPLNFNFPLATAIIQAAGGSDATDVTSKLGEMKRLYPAGIIDAPFLTNHDQVRVATVLNNDPAKLRSAAAVLLTLPGAPFVYYGEEVGLQNGTTSNDEAKRTPMPWNDGPGGGFTSATPWFPFAPGRSTANVEAQSGDANSLLSRYRALIRARDASEALRGGEITLLGTAAGTSPILAYALTTPGETVLVVHNLGGAFTSAGPFKLTGTRAEKIWADNFVVDPSGAGSWTLQMPPRTSGVWRIR